MLNIFKKNTIFGRNTNSDLPLYYDNIIVEGKTTQETRSGKQILDFTSGKGDKSSFTFSNDTLQVVGNNATYTSVEYEITDFAKAHIGETIRFDYDSFSSQNSNLGRIAFFYYKNGNKFATLVDYAGTITNYKIPSDISDVSHIYIYIYANQTGTAQSNTLTIVKPILHLGTTKVDYEPFGVMPSPDYPSELVSVGYRNEIDFNNFIALNSNSSVTFENNSLIITNNGNGYGIYQDIILEPNMTYTISLSSVWNIEKPSSYGLRFKNNTTGIWSSYNGDSMTFTTDATTDFRIAYYIGTPNTNVGTVELSNIIIAKGTRAHSYIPYGKYGIEIKTTGKNLFDKDNVVFVNKKILNNSGEEINDSTGGYTKMYIEVLPNTEYTISGLPSRGSKDIYYFDSNKTYIGHNGYFGSTYLTFTTPSNCKYIDIMYYISGNDFNIYQLELGSTATTYEEYKSNSQLYILDEPLRAIGQYQDKLYVNNGVLFVERKIGSIVLNGSENNWSNQGGRAPYSLIVDNLKRINSQVMVKSSNFMGVSYNSNWTIYNALVSTSNASSSIKFRYVDMATLDNFKTWLSTHNTEVQYVLATPTIETYELDIQPMIFDSLGYGTLSDVVSDPLITEELNGSYILEFEYMKNGKFSEYLVEENIIKAHGEPFSIYSVEKDTDEKIKILAKHWVINEWDKDFILDSAPTDLTAQNALAWIQQRSINHSDISISGDCTATSTARYVRKNMLSAIFKEDNAILTRFGGELSYNKNNVSVNKHRGSLSGLTIRQGKNLTGAKYYLDFSTVTTRLVPVGKDGLMLDEVYVDSPLINNYATPIIREVKVNTDNIEELRSYCNKLYENGIDKPTLSIKIDFIELSKTDEYKQYSSLETAHLGDEVTAYIPSLNLNVSTRIVKTVYNDNLKRITALELGSVTPNIATSSANVEKNLQKQVEQLAANDSLILDEAKEEASNLIKHPFGGYIYIDDTTGNMYIMDTNDINTAQNVWRWGLGGLGFSSTGVNGTYGIAMTQDGKIVADYIKSGTLQSVTIKATNGTVGGYKIGENKLYAETYSSYNFDSSDLTAIRNYLMDEGSLSDDELIKYDIDGNGVVDSRDYVLIRNFIELGVTKNKSAKIIMQTGNNIFENAYILQDANANDILNINFNGFIYDHPNNGKFNLSGSKLTLTDINNNSMTISPDWLPKSVLSNWYSTSSTTLIDAKKHKLLVILGKPTSSSGIVSLIIPTDALSTSNQQFQCADESKYVAFNVRYNNDDVIITGAGRSSDGSILSAWTLL